MSDTFDQLCARTPLFPRSDAPLPGTIVVKHEEADRFWGQRDCVVVLDARKATRLHGFKKEAFFSVDPGEHRVRVR